jgi:hypothetical protein
MDTSPVAWMIEKTAKAKNAMTASFNRFFTRPITKLTKLSKIPNCTGVNDKTKFKMD